MVYQVVSGAGLLVAGMVTPIAISSGALYFGKIKLGDDKDRIFVKYIAPSIWLTAWCIAAIPKKDRMGLCIFKIGSFITTFFASSVYGHISNGGKPPLNGKVIALTEAGGFVTSQFGELALSYLGNEYLSSSGGLAAGIMTSILIGRNQKALIP